MAGLQADFDVLASGDSSLRQIETAARDGLTRLSREVESLLSSGWRGGAAAGFAHGWSEWQYAAHSLLDALATMGLALRVSGVEYAEADAGVAAAAAASQGAVG